MFQIFRMQLRQILDGKKKWLVVLLAALPALLTAVNMNVGGMGELKKDIDERIAKHGDTYIPPDRIGAKRIIATDEPIELLDGLVVVHPDHVIARDRRVNKREFHRIRGGYVVIENGEVWVNEGLRRDDGRMSYRRSSDGRGFQPEQLAWQTVTGIYLFLLYPQMICLLLALFYGSSLLGSELENKTLTYLLTRPISRWRLIAGKYLAIVLVLVPPTLVSLCVSWFLLGRPGEDLLAGLLVGTAGGLLAYNAIFVLLGFIAPRRAMVLALVYGVVFEFVFSFVPAMVNELTVTYYLRSFVVEFVQIEMPDVLARIVGGASMTKSLVTLSAMVVGSLWLSSILAARREYVIADQA